MNYTDNGQLLDFSDAVSGLQSGLTDESMNELYMFANDVSMWMCM